MGECLRAADSSDHQTIAIPAIDIGWPFGYPPRITAETLFTAVEEFACGSPKSITKVKFLLAQNDRFGSKVRLLHLDLPRAYNFEYSEVNTRSKLN